MDTKPASSLTVSSTDRTLPVDGYLGLESRDLIRRNSLFTAREIQRQPQMWREAHARIDASRTRIDDWLDPVLATPGVRIYLCGAGSSGFIGETAAAWLRRSLSNPNIGSIAPVHTTELTADPVQFLGNDQPTLMVSFARSGDSPESVASVRLGDELLSNCRHLILTCNPDGQLARQAQGRKDTLCLVMPGDTHDLGFAMTSSFTAMLVSCLAVFTPDQAQLKQAASWAESLIAHGNAGVANLAQSGYERLAVLGTCCLLGTAREAALKSLELSAGRIATIHNSTLGFRHGPKIIVDESTLVVHLGSNDPHTRLYDQDLLSELRNESRAAAIVELSAEGLNGEAPPYSVNASALDDAWLSLVYLVYGQLLAFHKAMALDVPADDPCPSGQVNRVVKGVTIHPFAFAGDAALRQNGLHYGLDIGGTKIEFSVFDTTLECIRSRRVPTPTEDYREFLDTVRGLITGADEEFETHGSVGIALPGIVKRDGKSFAVNVPCLSGHNVKNDLSSSLGRPIGIINDGRGFALSEAHGGAADGYECMIGLTLGTGAVGGYCINGRLQDGRDGIAGEWGHVPIAATVRKRHDLPLYKCLCGATGCAECYVSGPGMSRIHEHLTGKSMEAADIVGGMREGDASSLEAFAIWIDCLASCVASMVLHINPGIIVIGGGLSGIRELFEHLPEALTSYLLDGTDPPAIVPARHGSASGVRGAAIVGAHHNAQGNPQAPLPGRH